FEFSNAARRGNQIAEGLAQLPIENGAVPEEVARTLLHDRRRVESLDGSERLAESLPVDGRLAGNGRHCKLSPLCQSALLVGCAGDERIFGDKAFIDLDAEARCLRSSDGAVDNLERRAKVVAEGVYGGNVGFVDEGVWRHRQYMDG